MNKRNAYQMFKDYHEEYQLTHQEILETLKRTSKYYGSFIGKHPFYNARIQSYLNAYAMIQQTTMYPLLFHIFYDFECGEIDEDELCEVLDYILIYFIRTTTCGTNRNLAKFMKDMYRRVFSRDKRDYVSKVIFFLNHKASNKMPSDKEFKDALMYQPIYKKTICKYLLLSIENSSKEQIHSDHLTIEHILPQKEYVESWQNELGEDYDKIYELYLHTLGNLTITGYNSELGTKSFQEKKAFFKNNSKANILNRSIIAAETWNEAVILKRADELSDIALQRFPYHQDGYQEVNDHEVSYSIDGTVDFSNRTPRAFVYQNEIYPVQNWRGLLHTFMEINYELYPQKLQSLASSNYFLSKSKYTYLTYHPELLRQFAEIKDTGIFYEVNLSANNLISFVRSIAECLGEDTDAIQVYLASK